MHGWNGGFGMGFMGLWWIAGLVLVAALAWLVVRGGGQGVRREGSAEEILKRRYARGEIGREEYQRQLGELRH